MTNGDNSHLQEALDYTSQRNIKKIKDTQAYKTVR